MMRPAAVLFDCDGVLVDSEPIAGPIIMSRLAALGIKADENTLEEMFLGGTIAGLADAAREMGAQVPDDWVAHTYDLMFAALRKGTPLIDGVLDLLDALDHTNIPYAVCSNGPLNKMDITLGGAGIQSRFGPHIYSGHVHGKAKPAPDLYLFAASQLGADPALCVVVEDSVPGARAGIASGARTMGYAAAGHADEMRALGAEIVMTMAELRSKLGLH